MSTIFADGTGFLVGTLHGVLFIVVIKYFILLCGVSRSMQQECFIAGCLIARMSYITFLRFLVRLLSDLAGKSASNDFFSWDDWHGHNLP